VVHDPDVAVAEEEVRLEQVVVTRAEGYRVARERELDPRGLLVGVVVGRRDSDPAFLRDAAVILDDPEGVERPLQCRARMDRFDGVDDRRQDLLALQIAFGERRGVDPPRDEASQVGRARDRWARPWPWRPNASTAPDGGRTSALLGPERLRPDRAAE
jgi:hypothetical protein